MKLPKYLNNTRQEWIFAAMAFGILATSIDSLWITAILAVVGILSLFGSIIDGPHLKTSSKQEICA